MKINIPNSLSFVKEFFKADSKYLAKLGGFTDGSYIVDYRSVLLSNYLISGGVGSNVRFESDFKLINKDVKLVFIDPTTSKIRMFIRAIYHFFKKGQSGYYSLSEFFNYLQINNHATNIYKYLGKQYTIDSVCDDLQIAGRFFLKLDIEGFEYDLLDSIVTKKDKIEGICIEFHDLSKSDNARLLEKFVRQLDFSIVNLSVNELSMNDFGQPDIIEISFVPKVEVSWPKKYDESYYLQNCNLLSGEAIVIDHDSLLQ